VFGAGGLVLGGGGEGGWKGGGETWGQGGVHGAIRGLVKASAIRVNMGDNAAAVQGGGGWDSRVGTEQVGGR